MKHKGMKRQLMLGSGTAAGVIIFLAIIVAIQYITLQHPKRWDLTGGGTYTLAPQSKKLLETFKEKKLPIEVLAFYESKDQAARESVRDLLDQYRDADAEFTYSFVDPDKERALALQHKIDAYPTIILKAGKKEERITTADEETVTNALAKLLRTEDKKVYFLKGHGELSLDSTEPDGLSIAKELIGKQNYGVSELVLMQAPAVPEEANILVIAGPKTDPLDAELDSIREYIQRGGSLLVLLNPFKTPKLAAFLKEYGFETRDDIVVDRMSRVLGGDYLMPVITTYIKSPITKNFTLASFFPETRSIRVAAKPSPHVEAKELCLTSQLSWTITEEQLNSGNANLDEKTGLKGPLSVMSIATVKADEAVKKDSAEKKPETASTAQGVEKDKKASGDGKDTEEKSQANLRKARLAVFGSSLIASNKFVKLQGNGDLILNTVSWLAEDENLIAVRPKTSRSQPFVLTASESLAFLVVPVFLIPLACILAGFAVYIYRRRTVAA
jgi:ABC-type uncharacterized transport system involved in gliding motility auxiliary subunit